MSTAVVAALAVVAAAVITAGPTWIGLRRVARRNDHDHERGRSMLGELLDITTEVRAWQLDHGHAHERSARQWRAFVRANPHLTVPALDDEESPAGFSVETVDR